jgi:argininosuccinate lyase
LELLRSRSAVLSGYASTVKAIVRSLPSGYNRDFQDTKEPFLRGLELIYLSLQVAALTMRNLKVNEDRLRQAFPKEIYATDAAFELVLQGIPFRDAYKQVGLNFNRVILIQPSLLGPTWGDVRTWAWTKFKKL